MTPPRSTPSPDAHRDGGPAAQWGGEPGGGQPGGGGEPGGGQPVGGPPADGPPTDGPPGEPADTWQMVDRYGSMVYGIALTHTRCRPDADDVFQEVFLAYHRRQPRCRSEQHRKGWLIVTTINCAKQAAQNSWRTRVVPMTAQDMEAAMPPQFEFATETQDAVFQALSQLPPDYRIVLHLFYFEDLPTAEIAQVLGLEIGAVKMRLSRGRGLMRDRLQGAMFDE